MYATIKNNKFIGVVYMEMNDAIKAHHLKYGLDYMVVGEAPTNIGTEENPDYGEPTEEQFQGARYQKLESIFNEKTVKLKLIAIDKPYMTNNDTIQNQYQMYSEMYTNAKNGVYSVDKNAEIITMNETARNFLANITILISAIRSVVEKAIASNSENIDELLTSFDNIVLTKENINDTYLAEISTTFGL